MYSYIETCKLSGGLGREERMREKRKHDEVNVDDVRVMSMSNRGARSSVLSPVRDCYESRTVPACERRAHPRRSSTPTYNSPLSLHDVLLVLVVFICYASQDRMCCQMNPDDRR